MDQAPVSVTSNPEAMGKLDTTEQAQLILARLMEGGQEDNETCEALDQLTKLLNEDGQGVPAGQDQRPVTNVIDDVCVDTVLSYLDMRQSDAVRGHAAITASAFLKAAGDKGPKALSTFFFNRVQRATYDDYIVAFCVAAAAFPIAPDMTAEMFLSEGFLPTLGPLMRRKWKSRKVETACLEMLNAASMNALCRDAIRKYCADWLEEIVDQDPAEYANSAHSADPGVQSSADAGSIAMRRHSNAVQNLAAVILAKLRAVPSSQPAAEDQSRIQPAETSIEDLSKRFTTMILQNEDDSKAYSVEGLAYASIQPVIKDEIAHNKELLKSLVKILSGAPPKSPLTYGALSIFQNLTRYQPVQSEEEKRMTQLKAYANAAGKLAAPNPLNDDQHVAARCKCVFEAGVTPVLVTHSKNGSVASLSIIVSIIHSMSSTTSLRGQLAQQGAVNLLIAAFAAFPESELPSRRLAAQTLARILISTNPAHVFGGTRARPQHTAIRPLVSILPPDPAADTRDLLPTFEALMALTNLASTDDETRNSIIRTAWDAIEEQLLSSNHLISKAAVELICNLVQSVEAIAKFVDGTPQAANRLHVLLALADAEDEGTRSAASGALATLTSYEEVVNGILERAKGVDVVLGMLKEESEDLRHRGVFVVYNMAAAEGDAGEAARKKLKEMGAVDVLKECAKKSRRAEVVQGAVEALKLVLEQE